MNLYQVAADIRLMVYSLPADLPTDEDRYG